MLPEFKPTTQDPWDRRKAAHLLWRAGFGPLPYEVDRALSDGLQKTVDRLLSGDETAEAVPPPSWTQIEEPPPTPRGQLTQQERMQRVIRNITQNQETKAWFLERFAFGKQPLREKMGLFWHGHFVTESRKVNLSRWVLSYVQFLRENSLSDLGSLLRGISREPAMLRYLDNNQNRKGRPNENYARELLELFSMGVGNYTEDDVKAAARAFTGWSSVPFGGARGFQVNRFAHDDGEKTFLGETGNFDGDDIIGIILKKPVTARFIAGKLCRFFAADEPPAPVIDGLAAVLRENGYGMRPALRALFRSDFFYSPDLMAHGSRARSSWWSAPGGSSGQRSATAGPCSATCA